jgi:hypothetical protein
MRSDAEINVATIGSIGRTVDGVSEVTSAAGSAAEADWFIGGNRGANTTSDVQLPFKRAKIPRFGNGRAIVDFRSRGRQSCRMMACMGWEEEKTKLKILLPEDLKKERDNSPSFNDPES